MRKNRWYIQLAACAAFIVLLSVGSRSMAASDDVLKMGAEGPSVVLAQHFLYQLGLLNSPPDGMFGRGTLEAVRQFQREETLMVDGVIGPATWSELQDSVLSQATHIHRVGPGDTLWELALRYGVPVDLIRTVNQISNPSLIRVGDELLVPTSANVKSAARFAGVELVHWSEASDVYANFTVATITDIATGKRFRARRYYGTHHADSEPYTARDTQVMREILGSWNWERRSIIVEVDGRRMAGSMNGMPHGQGAIQDNNFPGHFCIHFLGSRIHRTGNIDTRHQTAVLEAAGYSVRDLWLAHK